VPKIKLDSRKIKIPKTNRKSGMVLSLRELLPAHGYPELKKYKKLLSLGVKDIYLGPVPPAWVNDDILAVLTETYDLHLTGNPKEDLKQMLSA